MKVLTATSTGQGRRPNDFSFTIEGELVWLGLVCASDRRDPDGGCGCGRAFSGLNSHRATTTARVRDLRMTRNDLIDALGSYYESAGYGVVPRRELKAEVAGMLELVSGFPEDAIVERRLDHLRQR